MNIICRLLTLLVLLQAGTALAANPAPPQLVAIGQSEAWIKQLYLAGSGSGPARPRINDASFYFSPGPAIDPVEEARASYRALFSNLDDLDDAHPVCQFPSRFLFLNRALGLDLAIDPLEDCPAFARWSGLDRYNRILVVMVDGYYGNPASSFGHLVLRLSAGDGGRALLDTSINYGARIPEGEGPMRYIFSGLTGGYQASFTREEFYRQDLVYSRTEYRDMWNYELALSDAQRLQLVAHIWEVLGHPSTYYFIKNNCAFAVAEALEFVTGAELVDQQTAWFPPIRLFQALDEHDVDAAEPLVASRAFVPSQKRVLADLFNNLSPNQIKAAQAYIQADSMAPGTVIQALPPGDAAATLEALLEYYDYLIAGYPELGSELYERREALIVARLRYPPGRALPSFEPVPGTPPGRTARTSRLEIGVQTVGAEASAVLGVSPFSTHPTDLGNPDFSELTLLQTRINIGDAIRLEDLTAIRVSQRSNLLKKVPGDWPLSWTLALGADCVLDCPAGEGLAALAGIGQSVQQGPMLLSVMGYLAQHGERTAVRAELETGVAETRGWAAVATLGYDYPLTDGYRPVTLLTGQARYSFSPRHSFSTQWSTGLFDTAEASGRLSWHWHFR